MNWTKVIEEAKTQKTNQKSGLRQHIQEVLSDAPKEAREQLQGQPIGVWCRVLRAALQKYESHASDKNLYNKIRVNISNWKLFEVDDDNNVTYRGW